uniref:Integrase zinc-binding domain-containing protein n=1 Tax=Phlebotomus papatasi TaxID=29031 RepID=A0A1B0DJG4_PHLPP
MKTILARCMAIFKFWVNLPKRNTRQRERPSLCPSVELIRKAEIMLIQWYQMLHLESCFAAIQNNSMDSVTHLKSLRKLRPFIDSDGLLRVGGRLQLLDDGTDVKHPILLPKGTLANAIIIEEHERMLHAGPMLLLSTIRQRYWPLNGRNATRQVSGYPTGSISDWHGLGKY